MIVSFVKHRYSIEKNRNLACFLSLNIFFIQSKANASTCKQFVWLYFTDFVMRLFHSLMTVYCLSPWNFCLYVFLLFVLFGFIQLMVKSFIERNSINFEPLNSENRLFTANETQFYVKQRNSVSSFPFFITVQTNHLAVL